MDDGTSCGSNFRYHFWVPFSEPMAFCFFASFGGFGHVAAHSSTQPSSHHPPRPMKNNQPTHRGGPTRTTQRAHETAWRAAFDLTRRDAFALCIKRVFKTFDSARRDALVVFTKRTF